MNELDMILEELIGGSFKPTDEVFGEDIDNIFHEEGSEIGYDLPVDYIKNMQAKENELLKTKYRDVFFTHKASSDADKDYDKFIPKWKSLLAEIKSFRDKIKSETSAKIVKSATLEQKRNASAVRTCLAHCNDAIAHAEGIIRKRNSMSSRKVDPQALTEWRDKKKNINEEVVDLVHQKVDMLETRIKSANISDIDKTAYAYNKLITEACDEIVNAEPFYEAGFVANALSIAGKELTAIMTTAGINAAAVGTTKALAKGVGKMILSRLNKYTLLHPELVPISQFTSKTYDLVEANSMFKMNFKLAMKWGEKIITRVAVRVFSLDNKPQFAIAYGQVSADAMYNSEFVWIDGKFKKYTDFYTASAHAAVGIGHPSIKRMLDTMKKEWKAAADESKKIIKESCEEAFANGKMDECRKNLMKAYHEGITDDDGMKAYLEEMNMVGITDDDYFCEELDNILESFK